MGVLKRLKRRPYMPLVDEPDKNRLREKQAEQADYVTLYDPPVDGETPLDGEGSPRTSRIHATDVKAKLSQGFTLLPTQDISDPEDKRGTTPEEKSKRARK